jgi:hypothetical protein
MTNIIYTIILAGDWGKNFKNWIVSQATAVALGVIAIIIIPLVVKKSWIPLFITVLASSVALYFISNPDSLKSIGKVLAGIFFEGDL